MKIIIKNVSVEIHHSIDQIERYHGLFRRVYLIIAAEIPDIDPNLKLQMTFKIINDSVDSHDLMSTLLIFDAYSRMTELDALSPNITQRAIAMKKAMNEIRKFNVARQINDALNTRNGSFTIHLHDLPLNAPVLMYREHSGWQSPYKLLNLKNESAMLKLPSDLTKFRTISVKPFYETSKTAVIEKNEKNDISNETNANVNANVNENEKKQSIDRISDEGEERNSEYSQNQLEAAPIKRGRGRPRKHPIEVMKYDSPNLCFMINDVVSSPSSFSYTDAALPSYTTFRQKEISGLLKKKIFKLVNHVEIPLNARIFNARFVDEIKNADIEKTFEKSRFVMQTYNDQIKNFVLTQSPTIQRVSQRLIICLANIFSNSKLYFRNVIQIYVQFNTTLNRDFYIKPSTELATILEAAENCVFKMMKFLYEMSEADNH